MPAELLSETIATPRLHLRPYRADDVEDVLCYAMDEEWNRYLIGVPHPYLRSDAVEFLARQAQLDRALHPSWAIVLEGIVVGGINIRFRLVHSVAEMGWSIHRGFWGEGFATEAARAVVDAAFRSDTRLMRIAASADPRNLASLRVMEKIGMRHEGTLRQNRLSRDTLVDEAWFGLLRDEWQLAQK